MSSEYKPTIFMLVSTLSLSLSGVIAKYLTGQFSLVVLVFLRLFIPAIFMLFMMATTRFMFPQKNLTKSFIMRALCVAGCQMCFLYSLNTLTLVESVVLFAAGPLFIPIFEKILFGVKVQTVTKIGLVATFSGVLMLAGDVSSIALKPELLVGLCAAIFNAGSQLSLYRSTKGDMPAIAVNAWSFLFSSIVIFPITLWYGVSDLDIQVLSEPVNHWAIWLAVVVLTFVIISNQVFRSKAYKLVDSSSRLAPLIFTNLIFTLVWQVTFFNETLTQEKLAGVSLIIIASVLQVLWPKMKGVWCKPKLKKAHDV
ncbi:DMT family transporter [Vibrio sp. F74]|uniref:DMT family transporter n=1 Tax=Vibrio sp. F74 TaxID=700020 RepID=UPI0035F5A753